jgi:purine-binding chemotaxis protein CheW
MSESNAADSLTHLSPVDQYLTFGIGDEDYGIRILSVQEIRGWETVARVPNTPEYIKGVLNLRGTAVPVVDLRMRMELSNPKYDNTTVVIVVRAELNGEERIASIVVDNVSDVMNARSDEIKKTPDFGNRVNVEFISGLVDVGGKMVMLLDVETFMRHPDLYEQEKELE